MYFIASETSTLVNVLRLIALLIVFILLLVAVYYTTKWIGKSEVLQGRTKNVEVIEMHRIGQNKYIQILRIGKRYVAVSTGKDEVHKILELDEQDLDLEDRSKQDAPMFIDVLKNTFKKDTK